MTDSTKQELEQQELEQHKVHLSRWSNEDTLVNQRLTWLLTSQALLFAAYGTVATKAMDACLEKATYLSSFLGVISFAGKTLAVVVLVGIFAAVWAQYALHKMRKPQPEAIGVNTKTTLLGWGTGLSVPLIFFAAWLFVPAPRLASLMPSCSAIAVSTPISPNATIAASAPASTGGKVTP